MRADNDGLPRFCSIEPEPTFLQDGQRLQIIFAFRSELSIPDNDETMAGRAWRLAAILPSRSIAEAVGLIEREQDRKPKAVWSDEMPGPKERTPARARIGGGWRA